MKIFTRIFSAVMAILMTVSTGLNQFFNGDIYPYESIDKVIGLETLFRSQGVTTDGEAWIFSGKGQLIKVAFDNKTVLAVNLSAIPKELKERYGVAHIGGIGYANGYVYVPLEDSKVWQSPIVALYDSETLKYTGRYVLLDKEKMTRGVPWVACDKEKGLFYVAQNRKATEIFCYDLETFDYVKSIPLTEPVDRIQGADIYKGKLYAATNDATRAVYEIDLATGSVEKYFDRIMYQPKLIDNFGGEGEDIAVLELDDGTVFHALDIGTLFIDANLRHYKVK